MGNSGGSRISWGANPPEVGTNIQHTILPRNLQFWRAPHLDPPIDKAPIPIINPTVSTLTPGVNGTKGRIRDFPGDTNPKWGEGVPTYHSAKISWKLQENEENLMGGVQKFTM